MSVLSCSLAVSISSLDVRLGCTVHTDISSVSERHRGRRGTAPLFLSPPPPPPICRRRIKGGRTPASARAPAAAPAAHLPAELRRHRNLCAPAGRGAMVPPPPRPSRAYRRRQRPPPRPPPPPSHPPRPPPRTPLPPSHPLPGRRPDRRPGAAEAPPAATASPLGRPSHRRPLPPPISPSTGAAASYPLGSHGRLLPARLSLAFSRAVVGGGAATGGGGGQGCRRPTRAPRRPARVHNLWTQFHHFHCLKSVSEFTNQGPQRPARTGKPFSAIQLPRSHWVLLPGCMFEICSLAGT